jgi:hypothetical protein
MTTTPISEHVAAMPAANAATFQQILVRCRVKVNGTVYTSLYPSTIDAILDAQDHFGASARISVQGARI